MAERHMQHTPEQRQDRAPKSILRATLRGVALPLIAGGLVASTLAPSPSAGQIRPAAAKLPPYKIVEGDELKPAFVTPVKGSYRLTAEYGDSNGPWAHGHTGLDFAAPSGTTLRAAARGTVVSAEYDGSYGNKVVIRLKSGVELWYCHLDEFGVSAGDDVFVGTHVGTVGSTGNVTGPHLHLEVRLGDEHIDPEPWLEGKGLTL